MTGAHGATVREAIAADADAVLGLYPLLFEPPGSEPPDWDPVAARERLLATIAGERSAILVAEDDGLAGLCSVCIDLDSIRYGLRCWVEDLVVDPGRRGSGVGALLLEAARGWAREHGATHLELDSGIARDDAHRFYERERPSWTGYQYSWWLGDRPG